MSKLTYFLWHRDAKGVRMIGHNTASSQLFRILGSIALMLTKAFSELPWMWAAFAVGAVMFGGTVFGLVRNFKGKQA